MLIATHTVFGVLALLVGAAVLVRPKATRWHRWLGYVYVGAMVALCLESFGIRDSTPFFRSFGAFHVMALVSLVTVLGGYVVAWRRPPNWFEGHYTMMAWSYIGLVMATGSHVFGPVFRFFMNDVGLAARVSWIPTAALLWGVPPLLGILLLRLRKEAFRRQARPVISDA